MSDPEETLHVVSSDGSSVDLTIYHSRQTDTRRVVVCCPAMGVQASYYAPLAEALRNPQAGAPDLAVVKADLRGLGSSSVRASRRVDFGYREIVELDYPAILAAVQERFPKAEIFLLGHSLGGQLACLAASRDASAIAGIVLIASCSVHHREFAFPASAGVLVLQQVASWLAVGIGYFPGHRLGFAGREARGLVRDWGFQGRTGRYEVEGSVHNYETLLTRLELPILAISFTDDSYCPKAPVEALLRKMPAATKQHLHLTPEDLGAKKMGHFSWVRQSEKVVPRVVSWLNAGVAPTLECSTGRDAETAG